MMMATADTLCVRRRCLELLLLGEMMAAWCATEMPRAVGFQSWRRLVMMFALAYMPIERGLEAPA